MFTLPQLNYSNNALEPFMSAETIGFHYDKHHQAYTDNLNRLIAGTELADDSLENIIIKTAGKAERAGIFNNAAQYYNHNFFWQGLKPASEKMEPGLKTLAAINDSFGSLDAFYAEFKTAATALFGSGWVWLAKDGEILKIIKTSNGDNPLTHNLLPLWGLDVWEHSYYIDYQNRRADFVTAVIDNLLNWNFVEDNISR